MLFNGENLRGWSPAAGSLEAEREKTFLNNLAVSVNLKIIKSKGIFNAAFEMWTELYLSLVMRKLAFCLFE